jgi:hypothetical protein
LRRWNSGQGQIERLSVVDRRARSVVRDFHVCPSRTPIEAVVGCKVRLKEAAVPPARAPRELGPSYGQRSLHLSCVSMP